MPAKPPGYWDDFATLERELLAFIDAQGTPGVMPPHRLLRRARRHDLACAIHVHGGTAAVGERLGLAHRGHRRPQRYWQDPDNLERELLAFIADHGEPGVMPKVKEMEQAGRVDLSLAITRSGGRIALAERLGLRRTDPRRPLKQWADFAALERELRAFVAEPGRPQRMPTQLELRAARRYDLRYAVQRYGGIIAVARRLAWKTARESKQPKAEPGSVG